MRKFISWHAICFNLDMSIQRRHGSADLQVEGKDFHYHKTKTPVEHRAPRRFLHAIAVTGSLLTGKKQDVKGAWKEVTSGVHVDFERVTGSAKECLTCWRANSHLPLLYTLNDDVWDESFRINPKALPRLSKPAQEGTSLSLADAIALCKAEGVFERTVDDHQFEILFKRDSLRPVVKSEKKMSKAKASLIAQVQKATTLKRMRGGAGAAYLLQSQDGERVAIVKPNDEDLCTLNSKKLYRTPFISESCRVRRDIPQYCSAENEVLAYDVSTLCGFSVVPPTALVIKQSLHFHVVTDLVKPQQARETCYEKLCSAQSFVPEAQELFDVIQAKGLDYPFNKEDFEQANILCWITGDQDAHMGNFLVYGEGRIAKIDSGMTFGTLRCEYSMNELCEPHMSNQPLSAKSIQKIQQIPVEKIVARMRKLGKPEEVIDAFRGRVALLQELIELNPDITIIEIDQYMYQHLDGKA